MVVLIVAGIVLMDAKWGDPLGVALLVVAGVLAAVAICGRDQRAWRRPRSKQETSRASSEPFLGLLGGAFFPIGQDGGILARLTTLTPHYWFNRGLSDLAGGEGVAAALPAVGWLLVIAVVAGAGAAVLIRKQVAR